MIHNPILPGFNPDPSILRVGQDYYIATSTFEWFPGVQIYHSRDLVNWTLLTRPLNRPSQLNLIGNSDSGGVWAPCLSYADGTFFLIYSDVKQWSDDPYKIVKNYLITAPEIEGPWTDPIYLNSSGFDPSLFHDEDGRKWLVSMEWDHRRKHPDEFSGILLQEFCFEEERLIGPVRKVFKGSSIGLVEGPHLYLKSGYYYLMTAEGGTGYVHAVTIARSRSIEGPYEIHPSNPLLTSVGKPALSLQKAGHGSLVETEAGEWYLAHLCSRPIDGVHCLLGRETGLQKCEWRDDWIYLSSGSNSPEESVPAPASLELCETEDVRWNGLFDTPVLDLNFQSLRRPITDDWLSLKERPGWLRLKGNEPTTSRFRQSLIARRVQAFRITVSTEVDFQPESFQQMAGLIAYYDTANHYYLRISSDEDVGRHLNIIQFRKGVFSELLERPVVLPPSGVVGLRLELNVAEIQFSFQIESSNWQGIGSVLPSHILSDDFHQLGFTGAFIGMCAQDLVGGRKPADFRCFKYEEV